jgi:hypothetical protein
MSYVYDRYVDTICCLFAYVDVAPHRCEVELQRVSKRLPRGERRRHEDVIVQPAKPERETRRHRFDDPGVGPSHAPLTAARVDYEDIRHHLGSVLQDVPKGIWSRI